MSEGGESSFEKWAGEMVWNITLLGLLAGCVVGAVKGYEWWKGYRHSDRDCWYVVHTDADSMCVFSKDFGEAIAPSDLQKAISLSPPLFCGAPLPAADFTQKSGHRICEHTAVRVGAKFEPP